MEVGEVVSRTDLILIEYATSTMHLPPWDAIMIARMALHNTCAGFGDPDPSSFIFNDCILADAPRMQIFNSRIRWVNAPPCLPVEFVKVSIGPFIKN